MEFSKKQWQNIDSSVDINLEDIDFESLLSLNDYATKQEIKTLYFPLIEMLSEKTRSHKEYINYIQQKIVDRKRTIPFVIGVSGGVAAGKSTVARLLAELLSKHNPDWNVDLITTDGYILPKKELLAQDIMSKKGFPESYESNTLIQHLKSIKDGEQVPTYTYSHLTYDRLKDDFHYVDQPDILIIEGVNIFQVHGNAEQLVSDYIDYKIFLDVSLDLMKSWYIQRFLKLQESAFQKPESHFYQYKNLSRDEAIKLATQLWTNINEPNVINNIYPTKSRADLILHKAENHKIDNLIFNQF
ncbi:type I pantothenate kinase [Helicobacter pylori]